MATSILFDGVDDQMVYASPPQLTGALTMLIVCKILVVSDVTWLSFIEHETSGGAVRPSLGRRSDGNLYMSSDASPGIQSGGVAPTDSDGWVILAVTKATGSATPTAYKSIVGGADSSGAMSGTLGNAAAYASGNARIGGNDDFANMEVACAAVWAGTALTSGQIAGINTAKTSQSILDLSPSWMVDASDGLVTDQTAGTSDRTSVTGTAAGSSDPTGWVYLGGAAATSEAFISLARRTPRRRTLQRI